MKTTILNKASESKEVQAILRDLNKPSLHALSYSLRHPETWPNGFIWDYGDCARCAMGLAHQLWKVPHADYDSAGSIMGRAFAMPYEAAEKIFLHAETHRSVRHFGIFPRFHGSITPEMVADQIDEYLKTAE